MAHPLDNLTLNSRAARKRPVRVLFGCAGWPSGVLDVGSWAVRQGLADVVIYQAQPGLAFRLQPEDGELLVPGPIHSELVDTFALQRLPLSQQAEVVPIDGTTCEIRDPQAAQTYRVIRDGESLGVYLPENYDREEFATAIVRYAQAIGDDARLLCRQGMLSDAARQALLAVGGRFLLKLIDFRPHVVGFRLEGGDLDQIRDFIGAVRLFSSAEVVLGGPTATSHPREVLDDLEADYVFAGEAEETFAQFLELARQPDSKDRAAEIPGLACRYGGRTCHNTLPADGYGRTALDDGQESSRHAPRAVRRGAKSTPSDGTVTSGACDVPQADGTRSVPATARCLRNLVRPVTDADVLAANRLDWSLLDGFQRPFDSLYFTGGRGCPGACTFCAKLHGQEVRVKSARQLLEEIQRADARVAEGSIRVVRHPLFEHTDRPDLQPLEVAWAAVYDEDFFLHRKRAIELFELWERSPLRTRYRLSFQTNPCTLLTSADRVHGELLAWIDRLKPMIQVGAESFNQELLTRWRKRHTVGQLNAVLDALDATRQDYTVFILLTDFDTTPQELVETLRLLIVAALGRRRMRIASSPFTIPLFDSETRRLLEYRRLLLPDRIRHFSDYERPQPGWMDPLAAQLADLADAELRFALSPQFRDGALVEALEVVLKRVRQEHADREAAANGSRQAQLGELLEQAQRAMGQIREARFQAIGLSG